MATSPLSTSLLSRPALAQRVHWEYLVPIAAVHLLACLALLPWCFSWSGVALAGVGTVVFGTLGINLCYHRLLSHRSLEVPLWLERTLATIALCSLEDTPSRWVANHRLHHQHSDEQPDPHSPRDGILWAHVGWLFSRVPQRRSWAFLEKYSRDILADDYYRYLERNPWAIVVVYLAHAAVFAAAGLLVGRVAGGDWRQDEDSRNNWFVALVAMGEGWHNNHHHDPASASVQHQWWEFDVTYYLILLLERLGLAKGVIQPRHLRRSTPTV